jgi:hypothetical protein
MYNKGSRFHAGWRDRLGVRHRRAFSTAEEATGYEAEQKRRNQQTQRSGPSRRARPDLTPGVAHDRQRQRPPPAPHEEHQSIFTHREHRDQRRVSDPKGVSVRALAYKLPAAPQALAVILDLL